MPTRTTVVLIHGYLDKPITWQPMMDALEDLNIGRGWSKLAVTQDALAAQQIVGVNILEALAQQVMQQLEQEKVDAGSVVLVGHSMGGQVAELVARQLPGKIAGLVLINPAPLAGYPLSPQAEEAFKRAATEKDHELVVQARSGRTVNLDERARRILGATACETSVQASLAALQAWTSGHPSGRSPSSVTAPVLILGSDDKVFSPEFLAAEATRRFAGFQLKHIANAGHWPHLEQPAKVAEALSTFLQEINLSNSESAKQNNALQPVVAEIRDWFFGDYLSTWVAIGSNQKPLDTALEYWGVPMHVASVLQTKWLQTPTEVLAQIEASQAPLKAKGYDHTVVLDSEITVFNPTGACVDALWSRRRADGQELQRVASHFEVHRTNDGWRVVALANRLSESETLAGTSLSWTPEV